MEKRVLLAVFLSFLVLFTYQSFVKPPPRRPPPQVVKDAAPAVPPAGGAGQTTASPTDPQTPATPRQPEVVEAPQEKPLVGAVAQQDVVVDGPAVRAEFSNRGGVLKHWQLKGYLTADGRPVDLVPDDAPKGSPAPFSLALEDQALRDRLNGVLYQPSTTSLTVTDKAGSVQFEYRETSGIAVQKEFRFDPARPYEVSVRVVAQKGDERLNPAIDFGPALGIADPATQSSSYYQKPQAIYSKAGDVSRIDPATLVEQRVHEGPFRFVGVDDQYFVAVAVLEDKPARVEYLPTAATRSGATYPLVDFTVRLPEPGMAARFFIGPKDFDLLHTSDTELVRAIHFGVFGFLAAPLLRALKWINAYVDNYGWSIIILTILINATMFPLRHKSVVSMRKMQEIQPEVKVIQERYAKLKTTDPAKQKMNAELMNLYRERGVNPASGCIPMLLTMPVLFAFYSLLSVAIEIRGAPFMWWIRDLAQHDPLFITPILMGGTMFWQQKMTPSTADPTQQRIMMFMPIMFTVMFLWASSGLVIYWLVSNLWAIGQQQITNWIIGPPVVRAVRPPAERRLKRAGAGRTEGADADAQG